MIPFCLHSSKIFSAAACHFGMVHLTRMPHAHGQVAGTHQARVDARHRKNFLALLEPGARFDLRHQQYVAIARGQEAGHVGDGAESVVPREGADAALAFRRVA